LLLENDFYSTLIKMTEDQSLDISHL